MPLCSTFITVPAVFPRTHTFYKCYESFNFRITGHHYRRQACIPGILERGMDLLNPNTWPQKTSILQDAQANSTEEGRRLETLDADDNNVGVSLIDWMEVMCACQLTA